MYVCREIAQTLCVVGLVVQVVPITIACGLCTNSGSLSDTPWASMVLIGYCVVGLGGLFGSVVKLQVCFFPAWPMEAAHLHCRVCQQTPLQSMHQPVVEEEYILLAHSAPRGRMCGTDRACDKSIAHAVAIHT